jgi:hypothetical protein
MTRQLPHIPAQPGPGQSGPASPGGADWRYQGPTIGPASFGGDGAQLATFASATTGTGGFGVMDWALHPARTAMLSNPAAIASWMAGSQPPKAAPALAVGGGGNIGTQVNIHNAGVTPGDVFDKQVISAQNAGNRAPQMAGGAGVPT